MLVFQLIVKGSKTVIQLTGRKFLTGAYYCAFAALPYLKKAEHAKIITIGSGLGHSGEAGNSAYCVSKAGLWMLTRVLDEELKPHRISVNELIPGPVKTYQSS